MGKVRIKERFAFSDYGIPVPPTQTIITHKHYIEWQIGYDRVINKGEEAHFIGANGKKKQIYELSEFLDFGLDSGLIDGEYTDYLTGKTYTINNHSISVKEPLFLFKK